MSRIRSRDTSPELLVRKLVHGMGYRNQYRDQENADKLRQLGWRVCVVWECETQKPDILSEKLLSFLELRRSVKTSTASS